MANIVQPAVRRGMVGFWTFQENSGIVATDFSGKGHHGTLLNDVTRVKGLRGSAVRFAGADPGIETGLPSDETVAPMTWYAWIKPSQINQTDLGRYRVITRANGGGTRGGITIDASNIRLNTNGGTMVGSYPAVLNQWQFVMAKWTVSGWELWVNNVLRSSGSGTLDVANDVKVHIGNQPTLQRPFLGDIDYVGMHDVLLTEAEATQIYNSGLATINVSTENVLRDGLVCHLTFDGKDLNSTTALDSSGNGNHGTLLNSPQPTTGKLGQALDLTPSNTNKAVNVGKLGNLGSTFEETVTLSALIYPQSTNQMTVGGVINNGATTLFVGEINRVNTGDLAVGIRNDAGVISVMRTVSGVLEQNKWQRVSFQMSRLGSDRKIFVNGVEQNLVLDTGESGNLADSFSNLQHDFTIGVFNIRGSLERYFGGQIDDVWIHNRALTDDEHMQLADLGQNEINASTQGVASDNLLAHWTFNGSDVTNTTALDVSGNDNTITWTGSTPCVGRFGQARRFNGTTEYGRTSGSVLPTSGDEFTLSFLFRTTSPSTTSEHIMGQYLDSSAGRMFIRMENGKLQFSFDGTNYAQTPSAYNDGKWHRYTVTRGVGGFVFVLVDGEFVASATASGNMQNTYFTVGASNESQFPSNRYQGELDDIRIYSNFLIGTPLDVLQTLR